MHNFRLVLGTTRVEFDSTKDEVNRRKHKYSLSCAVDIFESALLLQYPFVTSDTFIEQGELRHMHLAEYQGRIVLIVTTMRNEETVRVISMRDASDEERQQYLKSLPRLLA
mgnify:CR=1 FL=1